MFICIQYTHLFNENPSILHNSLNLRPELYNEVYNLHMFSKKKKKRCLLCQELPSFLGPLARGAGRSSVLRNSAALNLKKV
jgi:hypothetical protein